MAINWVHLLTGFDGRISRQPFWIGVCVILAIELVAIVIATLVAGNWPSQIAGLIFYYPQLAITAKRAHDRNIPFWMVAVIFAFGAIYNVLQLLGWIGTDDNMNVYSPSELVLFIISIPIAAAGIALFIQVGFLKGTTGPNRFGPDPLVQV